MSRGNYRAVLILSIGLALIVGGALNGEWATVLQKAVHVCLECVGIG